MRYDSAVISLSAALAVGTCLVPATTASADGGRTEATIREAAVELDAAVVRVLDVGSTIQFEFFDDVALSGVIESVRRRGPQRLSVAGRLDGETAGTFRLATVGEAVVGHVESVTHGSFRIWHDADGTSRVEERDAGAVFTCDSAGPRGVPAPARLDVPERGADVAGAVAGAACDDGSVIDLLILYTAAAQSAAGGAAGMQAEIDIFIDYTNDAYVNSTIPLVVNVVHTELTFYDESGNHLVLLTEDGDGIMDNAHTLRDEHGADLVALIRSGGGGSAWGLQELDPTFEQWGFSQNGLNSSPTVLPHEIGHNEGCCHAVGDGGGCGDGLLFDFSNGWRFFGDSGEQWRTIMAYSPGSRIAHFSSPEIDFDGQPTGVPDDADNVRTIQASRTLVSNYRCSVNACPADFDGNFVVNTGDLLALLAAWGSNDATYDVDGSGVVDAPDLLALLAAWGLCP